MAMNGTEDLERGRFGAGDVREPGGPQGMAAPIEERGTGNYLAGGLRARQGLASLSPTWSSTKAIFGRNYCRPAGRSGVMTTDSPAYAEPTSLE